MDMAQKIKFYREKRGMTLEELGNKVGVGKSTVRKWETGMIANMKRDKIAKIADALNISPGYLMGWSDDPNYSEEAEAKLAADKKYYVNDETAQAAQAIFEDEDMRLLFDAAKGSKSEDIKRAADFLKMLKATNPEG